MHRMKKQFNISYRIISGGLLPDSKVLRIGALKFQKLFFVKCSHFVLECRVAFLLEHGVADINGVSVPLGLHVVESQLVANGWISLE